MTLPVLNLRPDQTNYALTMSSSTLVAQVDGGAPRSRADVLNPWTTMTVQWTTDNDGYEYLQQAYRYTEANGGAHFMLDLFLSHGNITTQECMFVPGTFALTSQQGEQFVVTANIYVAPSIGDDATWPPDSDYQSGLLVDDDGTPIII